MPGQNGELDFSPFLWPWYDQIPLVYKCFICVLLRGHTAVKASYDALTLPASNLIGEA